MDRTQPLPSQSARPGAGGGAVSTHLLQCDGSIETGKEWRLQWPTEGRKSLSAWGVGPEEGQGRLLGGSDV